jgi:glutamate/tyrosine decarboxylase-like PLP-dependent enzyme
VREQGRSVDSILEELDERQSREPDVHGARLFGLVYPTGRHDLEALVTDVYHRYLFGNALNPLRFVELAEIEHEVIGSVADLVNRPPSDRQAGAMTSGGTESILMSMLVHRERARSRGVETPQILAPHSAHPAYAKAAHFFDMELVQVPLDQAWRADVAAARALASERTAVIVASAFNYPHGVMDPVEELAALAADIGAGCHVDACIGGFVLPFLERLGHDIPPWDFRVPGVTAMSVDVHKYGYVPKGASVVLHRDDDWFFHQVFFYDDWPSGVYASPAVAGARPAAPIAAAWAMINHLGAAGYTEIMGDLMETVATVRAAVDGIDGIELVGDPVGPVLAMQSDTIDLAAVGDVMDDRGWHVNRNTEPPGLHLMLSPAHGAHVDQLAADLIAAVADHGPSRGVEARYA